ncbi:unnamed protein product [Euphydryas editha]|uniref:MADF domain-containing protein n=1 Tax=Euphydryas editha TaxID=104508 RepID=A0AAU9VCV3_EUPED|nr:unnamed protein product [Euphydryas editha]
MDVDFTEKLIQEVRNRPILYLLNHPDYKNNMKKLQAWREIQRELNEEVVTLKAKWKNLKDSYKKYKLSKKSTSGQAAKKLQNWTWADQMNFIDPAITLNETQGSMASLNVEEVNSTNSQSTGDVTTQDVAQDTRPQETQNAQQIYRRHRRSNPDPDPIDRMIQYLQNRRDRNRSEDKVDVKCDGVDLLFLGYADTFKKLSKRTQIKAKFDIARILMEAELSDLEAVTSNSNSTATGSFNYSVLSDTTHSPATPGNYSMISDATVTDNANYYILPQEGNTAIPTDLTTSNQNDHEQINMFHLS